MDNTKTDLLQTIQNTVAKEFNYKDYDNFLLMDDKPKTSVHFFIGEVCKRYAFELSMIKAIEDNELEAIAYNQAIEDALNEFSEEITPAEWYQKIQKLKKL